MTKTKQNKSILYLLAIALMVAIMSVACKNKPTQAVSFSEAEDEIVEPTPTPEPTPAPVVPEKPEVPGEGLKPISGITINANENLSQFENYTFINENGEIATIKYDTRYYVINNKHSIHKINWRIELPDGSKLIQGQGAGCRGNSYAFREGVKADVKFAADGYMYVIKDGSTVKYALNSK